MDFTFSYSLLWLIPIILISAGVSYWMYLSTKELLSGLPRTLLTFFRFLVFGLIGLLLLQPMLVVKTQITYPPIIAVLQDLTESLVVNKDSVFIRDQYPALLNSFAKEFDSENYSLEVLGFGTDMEPVQHIDSLQFDQTGTNIAQALKSIRNRYQNQNLAAIVLATDGINTAGVNPLYTVSGMKVPVYPVLVGDTTEQKDIRIKEVLFNEIAYLKSEMPVQVKVQSSGFNQAKLKVSLLDANKVLATQNLDLGASRPDGEVNFLIKPQEVGLQQFRISVSRMDGEITYRNNFRRFFVNVLETRVKIALFAGAPHPDLGAIRKALKREDSYEVEEFILKRTATWYNDPAQYNLEDYDLFILHNFPHSSADKPIVAQLLDEVKTRKKPVIHFVGKFTDLNTLKPLYEYMALTPKTLNPKSEEVIVDFAREYTRHSTYTFPDTWIQWMNNAPPIYRNNSNWQAKTTAEVFATAKIKNIRLNYPVYALQNHLSRKNMVFLGENFWRIRAHSYVESGDFEQFDGWIFNNIKWLIVSDDKRKFKVTPSKRIYTGGEVAIVKGQAYDDSYNPIPGVDIKFILKSPDGKENDYYLSETGEAQYFLDLNNLSEGTYSYTATGRKNEVRIGQDRGQFSVGKSNVEHFQLQADQEMLQQVALRTEGEFYYARELSKLAEELKSQPGMKPHLEPKLNRTPFHNFSWILILLLSLLCVEWITRKVFSLL